MEGDLNIFFIVFGVIFLVASILLILSSKMAGKPWGQLPVLKRSGGAVTYKVDEDKITFLDYHPASGDDFIGKIELLADRVSFIANDGEEKISVDYKNISKCRLRYSTLAMITGGNSYHYLDLYKKGESHVFVTFRFYGREWPYVKELKAKIERNII